MTQQEFDPVKEGQKEAAKNAKADVAASDSKPENIGSTLNDARKLAKQNAKADDERRDEAEMSPQDVGTAERDIPEGAPVTDEPEESETNEKKASSKNANVKKDMKDEQKRQDTNKDSATPSPKEEDNKDDGGERVPVSKPADKK